MRKRVADVIYSIPYHDGSAVVKLTIILEHKSQSSSTLNRTAIVQTLVYLAEYCLLESLVPDSKTIITQPIPVIIYTGLNGELEKIDWRKCFPLPFELAQYGLHFPVVFFNMTRLRRQGALPKNPFLEVMYDIMTRRKAAEFNGFEKTAFKPLERLGDKWTEQDKKRAQTLLNFFISRAIRSRVSGVEEKLDGLISSINLEEKMGKDVLYNFFVPHAKQAGIAQGIEQGAEQERNKTLVSQRARLRSIIKERFGACPVALRKAFDKIFYLETLFNVRFFAMTQAQSAEDVLENVRKVCR